MRSPKIASHLARAQYYRYYAGYSNEFVQDMLEKLTLAPDATVLDPWNGSGTTTTIAALGGINSIGFDVNPAAVLMGRARLLRADIASSIDPIAAEICKVATSIDVKSPDDPLRTWFGPVTAATIRSLEMATYRVLVDEKGRTEQDTTFNNNLSHSSLAAGFYIVLFRMVRKLVKRYVPSNPTWIKNPTGKKLGIPAVDLVQLFRDESAALAFELNGPRQLQLTDNGAEGDAIISLSRSTALPLEAGAVSAILSSPPYCTRIDYVKATLPELSLLGLTESDTRNLRDAMIGTPTMVQANSSPESVLGEPVERLLQQVQAHSSRASATYYLRYYQQYFEGMSQSLAELKRVLRDDGQAVLVIQDSYYKDIHVDLPSLIGEMASAQDWQSWKRFDFIAPRTMASINPGSRKYRSTFHTVESALVLQKGRA